MGKLPIFDQNHGLTKNPNFSTFLHPCFNCQDKHFSFLEYREIHFSGIFVPEIKGWKNFTFVDQNHGLTPLEKSQFCQFLNSLFFFLTSGFYGLEKLFYRSRTSSDTFSWPIFTKNRKIEKSQFFEQNHRQIPILPIFKLFVFIV